jgi:hypothetical protein
VTGRDRELCTCLQTQLEVEAETARVAAVPAEGLVVRLNSLARLLDALAAQEAKIQEWWQDVRFLPPRRSTLLSCVQLWVQSSQSRGRRHI